MVELTCLGPPQLRVDGAEAPPELVWRKHLALLVYLARSPRGRTRDHLMGLLWSDKDQAKARHSLNEALRVLRRSLGDQLLTEGDLVRVTPGAIVTDLEPLDVARIGGEFLEGFVVPDAPEFEDWVARERTQLRGASLDLLVQSAERALDAGQVREARDAAGRAMGLDQHHEPAALVLMRAHVLEGARALALDVYQRLADALRRDLNAEPSPAARELADRARSGVVLRGTPATPPVEERVPLVGTGRRQLVALLDAWREAAAGSARLMLLRGDPGTGKTRLADELAARARLDGAAVAYARALEGDSVADLVGAWVRGGLAVSELAGAPPPALAGLAAADPDLLVRFPGARSAAPQAMGEALTAGALAVAEIRPLLLVLDDAHRAAPEVLAAIGRLAQRGRPARLGILLTVATQSAADTDVVSERIGRDLAGTELATGPLADADVGELVAWALPDYRADEAKRLVRRVMADTAGNPFLAVELVLAVRAGLTLSAGRDDRGEAWPARRRTLDETLPSELPPSVAAALRRRYRALSESAQRALAALAVLGGRTPLDAVARGADVARAELEGALDELEWQRWLVGDAHGYAFVTRLAREVILADMVTAGERRRIRERAGTPA